MPQTQKSQFNLATILTMARFFLVPLFVYYFLINDFKWAVITLVIASITDVTDGFLARRLDMGTKLGSVLDPLADKFLMMISFIVLAAKDILPLWLTAIVIGRDLYIVFGLIYMFHVRKLSFDIRPTILSKRTTFAQFTLLTICFIKAYILAKSPAWSQDHITLFFAFVESMIYVVAVLTITTFMQYTLIGMRHLNNKDNPQS